VSLLLADDRTIRYSRDSGVISEADAAIFFLACVAALELEQVVLEEI
jgi:hypothetical protein